MKRSLFFLINCILFFSAHAQDFWLIKDSVNGPGRSVAASFVAENQGWVVGGLDDSGFKRKMYSYNANQDDWDDELSLGGLSGSGLERGSASGFSIHNKGYICLGQGDFVPYRNDLWEYDPATQTWAQKADFIGEPRRQAVAFTLNNKAYVGTGQAASGLKKDFYRYDADQNIWAPMADFAGTARRQAVSFVIGAYGYIATGDDGVAKNDMWQYSPIANAWVQKASFPGAARSGASAWEIENSGFIALGEDASFNYHKDVWQYYFNSNSWEPRADFPSSPRKNAIAFVLDGVAFVGTGYDGDFKDDFYAYAPILSLDEKTRHFISTAFPNPTQELSTISLGDFSAQDFDLTIFSITGADVTEQVEIQKIDFKIQLNFLNLKPGNYLYRLKNKKNKSFSQGKITRVP